MNMPTHLDKFTLMNGGKLAIMDTHVVVVDQIVRHGGKNTIFFHVDVVYSDKREFLGDVLKGTKKELDDLEESKDKMITYGTYNAAAKTKWTEEWNFLTNGIKKTQMERQYLD